MEPFCVLTFLMLGLMAILPAALSIGVVAAAGRRRRAAPKARSVAVTSSELGLISEG